MRAQLKLMQAEHTSRIATTLQLPKNKVMSTLKLLEDGASIPFIARYRKEVTGSLDEVQIAEIQKESKRLGELEKRKDSILKSIEEQGKLTPELRQQIVNSYDLTELEDLYLPYKRKRKTRASMAREKGLEPLAEGLWKQGNDDPISLASKFLNDEVTSVEDALQGARDILAERINEDQKARNNVRRSFEEGAIIKSRVARGKDEEGAKYRDYFEFEEGLKKCPSHRLLAIRRGEEEGFLRVSVGPDSEEVLYHLERQFVLNQGKAAKQVQEAIKEAYKRLLAPSIETEFRNLSKTIADAEAIEVFTENLRQLLLAAPLGQKRVLAIDPGFRTGCKTVCLDASGNLLDHGAIFPHPPQSRQYEAVETVKALVHRFELNAIAVGNGTAGRETMSLFRSVEFDHPVQLFMVNESGASIYSASAIAREEFPDKDVTVRGAVSIGRRLMDPLAELVKIDPKSIGVGQYQHDVNQGQLKESLDRVVESCVNSVGVNLNTASKHLLTYVSGLGPTLAQNIVDYRQEKGQFQSREDLKQVKRMGDKAFEQSAGFLRIREAANPLDNTAVHPERYALVQQMADDLGYSLEQLIQNPALQKQIKLQRYVTEQVGLPTLNDILAELKKPGLDPRGTVQAFEFAQGVNKIEDVKVGMVLPGIVTNVTNFGAFVDIGVKQDGLVHISQLANRFVKSPADVVKLQQKVKVRVQEVDLKRQRIQLSMKDV